MGQRGLIKGPKQMLDMWEKYKERCDNRSIVVFDHNKKTGDYDVNEVIHPVTYTIKGFAVFLGMTEQNFYSTYSKNPKFEYVIARVREECEVDTREKFELGMINPKLAGLWMSKYGYSTREVNNITGADNGPLEFAWPQEGHEIAERDEET
ncbi:MAG: hypothetical protein IJ056_09460 [Acidaminococcaceae bacterium]|nr:hypothetical protein [Acidaminococcaceae bacterium]